MIQQQRYKTTEQKIDEIHREIVNNDSMLDFLNLVSIGVGFYNTFLNRKQISNTQIMDELRKQDNVYFKEIISLLKEIKGEKNDDE